MCLLVVCNPNSTPSKDDLHAGACSNPHGFGFAISTPEGIISERGMSAKKIIKRFLELREQYPDGYAMWHARYATHGVKNENNCHPFKVGTDDMTYLAHNGVLNIHIPKGDKRSDTRILAEELLPRIGGVSALDDEYIYDMVSEWASGSKLAIMTIDPKAKYEIYIVNEDLGSWDEHGIWWSNSSHKRATSTPRTTSYHSYYAYDDTTIAKEVEEDVGIMLVDCGWCGMDTDLEDNPYYCTSCMACFDCGCVISDCLCVSEKEKSEYYPDYDYVNEYLRHDREYNLRYQGAFDF
jgi:glutamine amidotransferase